MRRRNSGMRTTIDLDARAHRIAKAIAQQRKETMGQVISEALLAVFCPQTGESKVTLGVSEAGFPTFRTGRTVTLEEVEQFLESTE